STTLPPPPSSHPSSLFSRYAPPRHLHSFPTRRSSDLPSSHARSSPSSHVAAAGRSVSAASTTGARRIAGIDSRRNIHFQPAMPRSEEHTSELQSPYDLVCRLLLEKKKQKQKNH